jgi:hypothetical protein
VSVTEGVAEYCSVSDGVSLGVWVKVSDSVGEFEAVGVIVPVSVNVDVRVTVAVRV